MRNHTCDCEFYKGMECSCGYEAAQITRVPMRDQFATAALQGMITAFYSLPEWHGWKDEEIAAQAYKYADDMLKAREQPDTVREG